MATTDLQQQLFNVIKTSLPSHISLAEELSDVLGLSADSVYRRIRGEKPLSLSELKMICEKFHLSLDQVLQLENDSVVFQASAINTALFAFTDYLKGVLKQLQFINSFKERQIFYLCKDLPIWQFYLYPELGAFKTFFWSKTLLNQPEYSQSLFSLSDSSFNDCFEIGQEINREYSFMPCVELWNKESINSTLSQIEYYRDAGLFKTRADLEAVVESFEKTLIHLERQAEKGVKFMPSATELTYRSPVQLYINEVVIGSNTILAEVNNARITFIPYNIFSYMITKDVRFNENAFDAFKNLVSRSTLISGTGEKERTRVFRHLKQKVRELVTS
jgi:hypothetical protein